MRWSRYALSASLEVHRRTDAELTLFVQLDMKEPYDWDAYASVFAPHAEKLVARAEEAEKAGEIEKASVLYL